MKKNVKLNFVIREIIVIFNLSKEKCFLIEYACLINYVYLITLVSLK